MPTSGIFASHSLYLSLSPSLVPYIMHEQGKEEMLVECINVIDYCCHCSPHNGSFSFCLLEFFSMKHLTQIILASSSTKYSRNMGILSYFFRPFWFTVGLAILKIAASTGMMMCNSRSWYNMPLQHSLHDYQTPTISLLKLYHVSVSKAPLTRLFPLPAAAEWLQKIRWRNKIKF